MNIGVWMPVSGGLFTLVDREAQPLWDGRKWCVTYRGKKHIPYIIRKFRYGHYDYRQKILHSLLVPCPKGFIVDHINSDTLDNRVDNLRICTVGQNASNRSPHKQYKGVSPTRCGHWRAYVHSYKKFQSLGYYDTAWAAAQAYNKRALELWGEYAKLNVYNENWGDMAKYRAINGVRSHSARINAGEAARKRVE